MSVTKFILIRHGQTYLNKYNRMQGWCDSPLTDSGIEAVIENTSHLTNEIIECIYSSDMLRTQQTAKILQGMYFEVNDVSLEILSDKRLREICFGMFEGELSDIAWNSIAHAMNCENMIEMFETNSIKDVYDKISEIDIENDAENYSTFMSRISRSLTEIANKNIGKTVAIVTHGNVIRTILSEIIDHKHPIKDIANGQAFEIFYSEGKFSNTNITN